MSMNIAVTALNTSQAALQVIGHNIANVNTAGYSRQTVSLQQISGQQLGPGYFGKGVQVEDVRRAYDLFLTREANATKSAAGADAARYDYAQRIESLFPIGAGSLGGLLNDALNAWVDVASNPSDQTARQVVLDRVQALADRIRNVSRQLEDVATSARLQSIETIKSINDLAQGIAALNNAITRTRGSGATPNDLLDQRDLLISQLNEKVQVSTLTAEDGSMSVFVAGSLPLVLGGQAASLAATANAFDVRKQTIQFVQGGVPYDIPEGFLGQGELAGLQRVVNEDIPKTQAELGRMALALAEEYNRQQRSGLNLAGQVGSPLFALDSLNGTPSATNTGSAVLAVKVFQTAQLQPTDYEVTYLAPDQVNIRRTSDGQYWNGSTWGNAVTGVPVPQTLDGLTISQSSGTAQVGDRYMVKPAALAAASIRGALAKPAELAVASPVGLQALVDTTTGLPLNAGNSRVESVSVGLIGEALPALPLPASLTFSAGNVALSGFTPASVPYTPGQSMVFSFTSGGNTAQVAITLRGQLADGDSYLLSQTSLSGVAFNAGNANAFLGLRDKPLFDDGRIPLSEGYVVVFTGVASRLNEAQLSSNFSSALAQQAETRRANQAGVNLDEEAARLLQYQQMYQASAKYLQTAQSLFDTLLSTFR